MSLKKETTMADESVSDSQTDDLPILRRSERIHRYSTMVNHWTGETVHQPSKDLYKVGKRKENPDFACNGASRNRKVREILKDFQKKDSSQHRCSSGMVDACMAHAEHALVEIFAASAEVVVSKKRKTLLEKDMILVKQIHERNGMMPH